MGLFYHIFLYSHIRANWNCKVVLFSNDRFDLISFNPPFTDYPAKKNYHINFWDKGNASVRNFFKKLKNHLTKNGRAFISWSSFGNTYKLKKIAAENGYLLKEIGRNRSSKTGFLYYVYKINPNYFFSAHITRSESHLGL